MAASVIAWDIETVPDLKGFAAANGHIGKSDDEIHAAMADKFPKCIYHSIIMYRNIGCPSAQYRQRHGLKPWIEAAKKRLRYLSPILVMCPSRSLPPLDF
jgi:hypothetical protein